MTIAICIGTFGDASWKERGLALARATHTDQTARPVATVAVHGATLHEARNEAARQANGADWLVFLDADDELDAGYVEAMSEAVADVTGDALVQPATLGVYPDGSTDDTAVLIPRRPLLEANFMVIGTMVRRAQFLRLGGFRDWAAWEDWDLWLRCWCDGAELLAAPEAIYRVGVNPSSRNKLAPSAAGDLYRRIRDANAAAAAQRSQAAAAVR